MKPKAPLEVRGGALLLRVRADQRSVQVDHHLSREWDRRTVPPHRGPRGGTSPADRSNHCGPVIAQGVDQPADRGVRSHRAEQLRLGAHHRGVSQTVTAQRDSDRQIQHRLAWIVHRPRGPPRTQRARKPPSQAADRGGLKQQGRPAERDQRLAAGFDTNTYTTAVTLHLRSAFQPAGPGPLTSPSFPCWTGTSVHHAPNKPRSHERSRLVIGGSRRNSKPATMRVRLCGNAPYAGTRVHTRNTRVVRYSCVSVLPAIPSPVRMSTTRGDRRGLVTLGSKEYAKCPTSESSVVSRQ